MLARTWGAILLVAAVLVGTASAEISPEIRVDGRAITSANLDATETTTSAVSDFSDTSLLVGFRQKLYSRYRGQFVLGFQFPDADSGLGQVFYHQVFLQVEDKSNILKIGRARVTSSLIEFPTLRDDDALFMTETLNPFSNGDASQETQYGNVIEVSRGFGQRVWFKLHGEHLTETPMQPGAVEDDFSMNTAGAVLEYRVPRTQRWNRPFLSQIGVGATSAFIGGHETLGTGTETLTNGLFSVVLNLSRDPVHFVDLRHQTIVNLGRDGVTAIGSYADLTRTRAIRTFTSLRYLYRKLEFPTAQLAVSAGLATYPDLTESTSQLKLVATGVYRLGEGFDVAAQFQFQRSEGDLQAIFPETETRFQIALMYEVENVWNNQFDNRDSLLNLEHGYIP